MPFAYVGAVAAVASVASSASNIANSGGGDGSGGSAYIPNNQGGADTAAQGAISGLGGNAGQGSTLAGNVINNPYAAGVIPGAQRAGGYLSNQLAPQLAGASRNLTMDANRGQRAAGRELNTAFDPQNALYNRTLQQTQDQTLAGLSATGVGNSPYGAGVLGQTLGNFNIDWQNNQLARQQSGLQSYDQSLGTTGNAYAAGGNLGNAAAGAITTGTGLPYSTYNGMQTAGLGALGTSSGLYGNQSTAAGNYLQIGQQGQQAGFNQAQVQGQQLGQGLSALSGYGQQLTGGGGVSQVSAPSSYGSQLSYQPTQTYDPSQYSVGSFG